MSVTAISMAPSLPAARAQPRARRSLYARTIAGAALEELCRQIEEHCPGVFAAVYVLGESHRRWLAVIAPNLPEHWRTWHRAPAGATSGACGAALVRGRRVVVMDVASDALYGNRRRPGPSRGGCWATPVLGASGEPVGVLALFAIRGGRPLRKEARAMDRAAELAAFLIEHHGEHHRRARPTPAGQRPRGLADRRHVPAGQASTRTRTSVAAERPGTGSWIVDARSGVLLWSAEMFRIWGLDPDGPQPTLDMALARVPPDEVDRVRASFRLGLRTATSMEGEHRVVRPDGSVAHVRYVGRPVFGRRGELLELVGTVRDVTEEHRVREQLQAALADMRSLAARQVQARDDERRRIARHLHETAVQDLAALRLNLATLARHLEHQRRGARALMDESVALTERALAELRTLSYLLHPPLLDEAGLESALRWYATGFAKRSGLEVRLELPPGLGRLPQEVETTLFRAVQECLLNIHRHARSRAAEIRMRVADGRIVTEVQDWGRGMTAGTACGGSGLGVGIAGMRERIEQLGGRLEIDTGREGTTVRAVLPMVAGA